MQTTTARNATGPWAPFEPIQILGWDGEAQTNNIYFAAMNVNPVDGRSLIGLFPVNAAKNGTYIGVALSCDGVRFSRLRRLLTSRAAPEGRGSDHPVDGLLVRGEEVYLYVNRVEIPRRASRGSFIFMNTSSTRALGSRYVHRDVPGITHGRPRIVRYATSRDALRRYTAEAKAELPESCVM